MKIRSSSKAWRYTDGPRSNFSSMSNTSDHMSRPLHDPWVQPCFCYLFTMPPSVCITVLGMDAGRHDCAESIDSHANVSPRVVLGDVEVCICRSLVVFMLFSTLVVKLYWDGLVDLVPFMLNISVMSSVRCFLTVSLSLTWCQVLPDGAFFVTHTPIATSIWLSL